MAPDVDPEMFDSATEEDDADTEYFDFLREFYTKPVPATSTSNQPAASTATAAASEADASEREDDDPDYNIFDDIDQDIEADPEEYQRTRSTEVGCLMRIFNGEACRMCVVEPLNLC